MPCFVNPARLLEELRQEHPNCRFSRRIDISRTAEAITQFEELIAEMEGADIVVLNAGVGFINPDLQWDLERETIEVDVAGFSALANAAMRHFLSQGKGHLVGISKAILARRSHAYVTKRWRLVGWLHKSLPDSLYHRI